MFTRYIPQLHWRFGGVPGYYTIYSINNHALADQDYIHLYVSRVNLTKVYNVYVKVMFFMTNCSIKLTEVVAY